MGTSLYERFQAEQGGSLYDRYLAEQQAAQQPRPRGYRSPEQIARLNRVDEALAAQPDVPSYYQQALGGVAALARGVPVAAFLQAGARSLLRGEDYADALDTIQRAEASNPVSAVNTVAGAAPLYALVPGSNMAKGAIVGGLLGFSDPNPEADRRSETVLGGLLGGGFGVGADVVGAAGSRAARWVADRLSKERAAANAVADFIKGAVRRVRGTPAAPPPSTPLPPAVSAPPAPIPPPAPPVSEADGIADALRKMGVPEDKIASAVVKQPVAPASPQAAPAPPANVGQRLDAMLERMRASQPGEVGNKWTDAEVAQGIAANQEADLMDLLRRSIIAKGGTPLYGSTLLAAPRGRRRGLLNP